MESLWMGIAPGLATTRVIAMAGPDDTIVKANLAGDPRHPRALATLLEAVALWQVLARDVPDGRAVDLAQAA